MQKKLLSRSYTAAVISLGVLVAPSTARAGWFCEFLCNFTGFISGAMCDISYGVSYVECWVGSWTQTSQGDYKSDLQGCVDKAGQTEVKCENTATQQEVACEAQCAES